MNNENDDNMAGLHLYLSSEQTQCDIKLVYILQEHTKEVDSSQTARTN